MKNILSQLKNDPINTYLSSLSERYPAAEDIEVANYREAYQLYYLTIERLLQAMSIARRFRNGPHYALKFRVRYSEQERKIADRYKETRRYLELDFVNFLLHSRILLDRTVNLAQRVVRGRGRLPSYNSFSDHRNFLTREENIPFTPHEEYAQYIREHTEWFEELKEMRDKFVVHTQRANVKIVSIKDSTDVHLSIIVPDGPREDRLARMRIIHIDVVAITQNIRSFQEFFNNYCHTYVQNQQPNNGVQHNAP